MVNQSIYISLLFSRKKKREKWLREKAREVNNEGLSNLRTTEKKKKDCRSGQY